MSPKWGKASSHPDRPTETGQTAIASTINAGPGVGIGELTAPPAITTETHHLDESLDTRIVAGGKPSSARDDPAIGVGLPPPSTARGRSELIAKENSPKSQTVRINQACPTICKSDRPSSRTADNQLGTPVSLGGPR